MAAICFCFPLLLNANNVTSTTLFNDLKGFGGQTTGGLGGQIYMVNRRGDTLPSEELVAGTLRYGIEDPDLVAGGATWIVFDAVVFPPETKKAIYLLTPLKLRDDITIDGRGSYVSIRKRYDWQDAIMPWSDAHGDGSVWECEKKTITSLDMGPIIKMRSVKNIIITHLDFLQIIDGEEPYEGLEKDTQCFNDPIAIYNIGDDQPLPLPGDDDQTVKYYSKIWINQSTFSNCGDECISIVRPSAGPRSYITLSRNLFKNSYKGIVIGGGHSDIAPYTFKIAVSLYNNRFANVKERSPRVQNSYVHIFNNVYENWKTSSVAVMRNTRVIMEDNVFRAGSEARYPWRVYFPDNSYAAASDNHFYGVTAPEDYVTSSFPISDHLGGPWYYDSRLTTDLSGVSYQVAIGILRPLAGWLNHASDVR